jgi:hypothetical protein
MRPSRGVCGLVAVTTLAAPAVRAEDPAVTHFESGVRLYQARNFSGALAEFEESYRLRPTPSSLQNIALCQRELFRYADAIGSLERMLSQHGATLPAGDARAARQTLVELQRFVADLTLTVSPPQATITIDGRPIPGEGERTIRLDVGEHRLVAEAPHHGRVEQTLTLASGQRTLAIALENTASSLTVVASDAEAAIAVDGVPRSFGVWVGELAAAQEHIVQVYKTGYSTTTLKVTLVRGERRELTATLGPPVPGAKPEPLPFPYQPPAPPLQKQGWYGLLTASNYLLNSDPDGFQMSKSNSGGRDGSYFGARVGYRLSNLLGLEFMFEAGKNSVGPGCYTPPSAQGDCPSPPGNAVVYELAGQRYGVNARFMSAGDRFRFLGVAGLGAARHHLTIPDTDAADTPAAQRRPSGSGSAFNAYAILEGGFELSFGRVLVDGVMVLALDGINNLSLDNASRTRAYTESRNAYMTGLGVRLGYALW